MINCEPAQAGNRASKSGCRGQCRDNSSERDAMTSGWRACPTSLRFVFLFSHVGQSCYGLSTGAGLLAGWMHGWMDPWLDGSMAGWMHGWMDAWMDGCHRSTVSSQKPNTLKTDRNKVSSKKRNTLKQSFPAERRSHWSRVSPQKQNSSKESFPREAT